MIGVMIEEVKLPRECVLCGHRNLQWDSGGWNRKHRLRYPLYPIPEDMNPKSESVFGNGVSAQREVQNKRKALMGDVDPLFTSDEKDHVDDSVSRLMVAELKTGEED